MSIPTPPEFPQEIQQPQFIQPKQSDLAVASMVTGILSWIFIPVLGALAAIITGHLAKKEIRESGGRLTGNGMAIAGLILGYVQLGFFVLAIIATILLLIFLVPNNNLIFNSY